MMTSLAAAGDGGRDGAQACTNYATKRRVRKELEAVIRGVQEEFDEAIRSIREEYPAAMRGVMKGMVKGAVHRECKVAAKRLGEELADEGMAPEEYEGALEKLEATAIGMSRMRGAGERVGCLVISSAMFVRGLRKKLHPPPNETPS